MLTKTDFDNIDKRTKKAILNNNDKLFEKLASKQDIKQAISDNNDKLFEKLASKQDVKQAISDNNHELLKYLVTKDELYANFATKNDLRESVNTLQITMDKIYGIVKKIDQEQTVMSHQVNNHESRLTKVEAILA